jgi:DNA gyrase/topoisomerase IV subunit B
MERSMLHPTERRVEVLTVKDIQAAGEMLNMLMGNDVDPRREFLFENVDFSVLNK